MEHQDGSHQGLGSGLGLSQTPELQSNQQTRCHCTAAAGAQVSTTFWASLPGGECRPSPDSVSDSVRLNITCARCLVLLTVQLNSLHIFHGIRATHGNATCLPRVHVSKDAYDSKFVIWHHAGHGFRATQGQAACLSHVHVSKDVWSHLSNFVIGIRVRIVSMYGVNMRGQCSATQPNEFANQSDVSYSIRSIQSGHVSRPEAECNRFDQMLSCRQAAVLADVHRCHSDVHGGESSAHLRHLLDRQPGHQAGLPTQVPGHPHLQDTHRTDL